MTIKQKIKPVLNKKNYKSCKAFISYCHDNDDKRIILDKLLKSNRLGSIVVTSRKKPAMLLASKIEQAIEEADYLIPILTKKAMQNQWVNQEIGYANKLAKNNKIKIIPLVEKNIMENLKGFIHNQMDLPFVFKGHTHNGIENKAFKVQCIKLVNYLKTRSTPKKSKVDFDATFLSLYLTSYFQFKCALWASMVLENTGNSTITIVDIKFPFEFTFKHYKRGGYTEEVKKKIKYKSHCYRRLKYSSISLKTHPLILKPREIRNLNQLVFTPIRPISQRNENKIYNALEFDFPKLDTIFTTFVFLSGETVEKEVKLLH